MFLTHCLRNKINLTMTNNMIQSLPFFVVMLSSSAFYSDSSSSSTTTWLSSVSFMSYMGSPKRYETLNNDQNSGIVHVRIYYIVVYMNVYIYIIHVHETYIYIYKFHTYIYIYIYIYIQAHLSQTSCLILKRTVKFSWEHPGSPKCGALGLGGVGLRWRKWI